MMAGWTWFSGHGKADLVWSWQGRLGLVVMVGQTWFSGHGRADLV